MYVHRKSPLIILKQASRANYVNLGHGLYWQHSLVSIDATSRESLTGADSDLPHSVDGTMAFADKGKISPQVLPRLATSFDAVEHLLLTLDQAGIVPDYESRD